jgi:competence protein ComGC
MQDKQLCDNSYKSGKEKDVAEGFCGCGSFVRARLRSSTGESLTETLVAVLIVSLASILLVSMVLGARRVISRSGSAYSDYIKEHSELAEKSKSDSQDSSKLDTVTITPENNAASSDYSLSKMEEKVTVNTGKDGNKVFFPADN